MRRHDEYRIYQSGDEVPDDLTAQFLMQVSPDGKTIQGFRFTLEGPPLQDDIWAQDLFDDATMTPIRFRYKVRADAVAFKANCFTSKWEDVEDLLAHGHLIAYKQNTQEDKTEEVRKFIDAARAVDKGFGAGIRWSPGFST